MKACQTKHCKGDLAKAEKLGKEVTAKTQKLVKQVMDKKITLDHFKKQVFELRENLLASKTTQQLMQCNIQFCEKEFRDSINATLDVMKYKCSKEACDKVKKIQKILKKSKLTLDDCMDIVRTMLPSE